jgi:hypothetical protein
MKDIILVATILACTVAFCLVVAIIWIGSAADSRHGHASRDKGKVQ